MIVRLEVKRHDSPSAYWQLKRCRVHRGGMMETVSNTAFFHLMRLGRL